MNGKLYKNTFILMVCTLINKGMIFFMIPFYTRWLSLEEYGNFDVYSTYIILIIPIITLATSNALFRLSVEHEKEKSKYIASDFMLIILGLVIAVLLIFFTFRRKNNEYLTAFCLMMIFQVLDDYFQGYLRALKRIDLLAIFKFIATTCTAVFSIFFIKFFDYGLNGLLLAYALGFFVEEIAIIVETKYWRFIKRENFSKDYIIQLIKYSWPLIPNDISWWVIGTSDRSIINIFLGATSNALYAISNKVPNLCSSVFGAFNISWQESASETLNYDEMTLYFKSVHNNVLRFIISICLAILSFNFVFFDYIFDDRYSEARLYTSILVTSVIFNVLSLFYGGIQISLKRTKANGLSTIVGAVVNVVTHLLLIEKVGLFAAAISTLLSNIIVYMMRKLLLKEFSFKVPIKYLLLIFVYLYYVIVSTRVNCLSYNVIHFFIALIIITAFNYDIFFLLLRKFTVKKCEI